MEKKRRRKKEDGEKRLLRPERRLLHGDEEDERLWGCRQSRISRAFRTLTLLSHTPCNAFCVLSLRKWNNWIILSCKNARLSGSAPLEPAGKVYSVTQTLGI